MTKGKTSDRRAPKPPRSEAPAIEFLGLDFRFDDQAPLIFKKIKTQIPAGARVLLIGANGVGKSTLLRLLSGTHLIPADSVRVLGRSPFHDLETASRLCFVGGQFDLRLDLAVKELLLDGELGPRESELLELFGVSRDWRMSTVSEGQRRRVQLLLSLRRRTELLLLDEVTAHLDVTMRTDFLGWLEQQSVRHGTTILYATHIFDGLDGAQRKRPWPTHLFWLGFKGKYRFEEVGSLKSELKKAGGLGSLCERWIRKG